MSVQAEEGQGVEIGVGERRGIIIDWYPIHFYGNKIEKGLEPRIYQYYLNKTDMKLYQYVGHGWMNIEVNKEYFYFDGDDDNCDVGEIYFVKSAVITNIADSGHYQLDDIIIDMMNGHFLVYRGQGRWEIKWSVFIRSLIENPKPKFADLYILQEQQIQLLKEQINHCQFQINELKQKLLQPSDIN